MATKTLWEIKTGERKDYEAVDALEILKLHPDQYTDVDPESGESSGFANVGPAAGQANTFNPATQKMDNPSGQSVGPDKLTDNGGAALAKDALGSLTKDQLAAMAEKEGVEISAKSTKAEMIDAIMANRQDGGSDDEEDDTK